MDGDRDVVWLKGEVKSPPFSREARLEAGLLLRRLQSGESVGMPLSRPMPGIGRRCHELRVVDRGANWRIIYRLDPDAVLILAVFRKKTDKTPKQVVETCKARLKRYETEASKS